MELIKIAWRNIWRSRTRSMVVILAVTFGMFGGGFSTAVMIGAINSRVEKAIENESSHLQIHKPGFIDNPEVGLYMTNSNELAQKCETKEFVEATSSRIKINSMLQSSHNTSGAMVSGIDPVREKQVSNIHKCLIAGEYFTEDKRNQIILSAAMAERFELDIRSKIVLTFQDKNGDLTGGAFRVGGIYKTSNKVFDEMNVFVNKTDLMELTGFTQNDAHEIAVLFTDNKDLTERSEIISGALPNKLDIKNWKELNPDLGMMTMMTEKYLSYLVAIILFALAFGIINTMLMAILERKKELGMLMAIGMNQAKIRLMIIWETLFLTAIGSILGLLVNQGLVSYLGEKGINLGSYSEGMESYGFSSIIYPAINGAFYLQIVILVIITALIASIFPIIRASKMRPAEVLSSN